MIFLLLLLVPLLVAVGTFVFGKRRVIWQEFAAHVCVSLAVAGLSCWIIYAANTADTEALNGSVTGKNSEKVSCSHSYCCMTCQSCSTDSKGHQSCHSYCCHTCYDHPFDVDWNVFTTIGEWEIDRIDRQGVGEPPRWTTVRTGDPVSRLHSYTNYIKAAPDSLFRDQGLIGPYVDKLPEYPDHVYDYYRLNRLVRVGVNVPDEKQWNEDLSSLNARVGAPKQANVVVVLTNESETFYYALRQHWLGGKKNDIVAVVGVKTSSAAVQIAWVHSMSWAEDDIFNVKLRDDLLGLRTLDRVQVVSTIESDVVRYFRRKPMADFEYLEASITPTPGQLAFALLINLSISVGLAVFFVKNEVE